jgi:DNA (cytosine-5)-methyltransferase 1
MDVAALEVPCPSVQQVLAELERSEWTPQRWHVGNRRGFTVWWGDSEGKETRLIWLTPAGEAALLSSSSKEGFLYDLIRSGRGRVRRVEHPRPELAYTTACRLEPPSACLRTVQDVLQFARVIARAPADSFTFCELFAGIGGFRLGLEAVGGRCVLANEWDAMCCHTYRRNFGRDATLQTGDVCTLDFAAFAGVDLLCAGFPCQPFSGLSTQPGLADPRGLLFRQIERFLHQARPRAFLLENVPGLLTSEDGRSMDCIASALRGAGYSITWKVVSAAPLTAQGRRRVYIAGFRDRADSFRFPELPELGICVGDVCCDDDTAVAHSTLSARQFDELRLRVARKRGLHSVLVWDHQKAAPVVSHYGHHVSRGESQLRPQVAPLRPRLFTPRECLRIMGFPEQFELPGEEPEVENGNVPFSAPALARAQYRMIGNAVCPPVIAALAGAVVAHLKQQTDDAASCSPDERPVKGSELVDANIGIQAAAALACCALPAHWQRTQGAQGVGISRDGLLKK